MSEWPTYTCSYRYKGREWIVHVQAEDERSASERLRAIGTTASVDGELVDQGALFPMGIAAIATVSILNWARRIRNFFRGDLP